MTNDTIVVKRAQLSQSVVYIFSRRRYRHADSHHYHRGLLCRSRRRHCGAGHLYLYPRSAQMEVRIPRKQHYN